MVPIHYPEPGFKIKQEGGRQLVFDTLRRKWLVLTPEEWVRQNFVQYLIRELHYPAAYIALEKEIQVGELKKRFDILVYDKEHRPWLMVECKAEEIKLDESVLAQALRYNISVPVQYFIITNGPVTHAWRREGNGLELIGALPEHI